MYNFTRKDIDLEAIRGRLARMPNWELVRYREQAAWMARHNFGDRATWRVELEEARAEWRRRHSAKPVESRGLDYVKQRARDILARWGERQTEAAEHRAYIAKQVDDAIDRRDWEGTLWLLPRPYRWDFFYSVQGELDDAEYARLLGEVWTDTEVPGGNLRGWIKLFTNPRLRRELLMSPEELASYQALPDLVEIWRGVAQPRYARGISWTTDPDQAAWFAMRFAGEGSGRIYRSRSGGRRSSHISPAVRKAKRSLIRVRLARCGLSRGLRRKLSPAPTVLNSATTQQIREPAPHHAHAARATGGAVR
jgi:hypothetical protein